MPSAAGISTSLEYNGTFETEEICQYCSMQNCCNIADAIQTGSISSKNGSVSVRISSNHAPHTCTTPVTELPGHRGSDRVRFVYPGCCRIENTSQPQVTYRGRSTQRRGRQMQSSRTPVGNDSIHLTPYPISFQPKINNGSNNLPPPHPYASGNKNQQNFSEGSSGHPYVGSVFPRKFVSKSTISGPSSCIENEPPSVLLATATAADNSSNQERSSRWSRHRGRARKRSPSARQRASASVIRHQDCSPPPVQRDRPPPPPSMEESIANSPPSIFAINGRSEVDYRECPLCQPRYSQSPEKLGVRPILSHKLSVDSSTPFVRENVRDSNVTGKNHMNGCAGVTQHNSSNLSKQQRRRRARSEYKQSGNTRRRQTSPDINTNNRPSDKNLVLIDTCIVGHEQPNHQTSYAKYPYNLKHFDDHQQCWSAIHGEKETPNKLKHENHSLSFKHEKQQHTDLNGNEDRIIETRTNEYEEPKHKTCKENLRKKFSCNNRSISKASKSRRHSRKGQQKYQEDDLKSPGLINRKDACVNPDNVFQNDGRKSSNISRSKSRSRYGQMANTGLQTIWPAKAGIWLPQ